MADRLPSDHDAVETHRAALSQVGPTDRPQVELPDAVDLAAGTVVRLVLDGEPFHARVETTLDGTRAFRRAADNARLAREGGGENRLSSWIDDADVAVGGSAHLDVVTEGVLYGLRTPGTRVVYSATEAPDSSLADIARSLEE